MGNPENKLSDRLKKNILDLTYNKYLQYQTTSIIISFTYLVGVAVAFLTKQLSLTDYSQMILLLSFSIIVLTPAVYFILSARKHLKNIIEEIKKLKDD